MSDVTVRVGLNERNFDGGLGRLRSKLGSWKKEQESAFSGLGAKLAGALTVGALVDFGKRMIDFGSELTDVSDELQMSVESFQELTYAFGQNGANSEVATKGLRKLSENIQAARDGNEAMLASFAKVGVSWRDLHTLSPEEILAKMADGLHEIKDPAEAVAVSLDLMGKSGARMAVTLRQGSDELARLRSEASKLTNDEAQALDQAGDQIDALKNKLLAVEAKGFVGLMRLLRGGGEGDAASFTDRVKNLFRPISEGPATAAELAIARARAAKGKEDAAEAANAAPQQIPDSPEARAAAKARHEQEFRAQEAEKEWRKELAAADEEFEKDKAEARKRAADAADKEKDRQKEYAKAIDEASEARAQGAIDVLRLTDEEAANRAQIAFLEKKIAANIAESKDADMIRREEIEKQNSALNTQIAVIENRNKKLDEDRLKEAAAKVRLGPEGRRAAAAEEGEQKRAERLVKARERDRGAAAKRNQRPDFDALFRPPRKEEIAAPPGPAAPPGQDKLATNVGNLVAQLEGIAKKLTAE